MTPGSIVKFVQELKRRRVFRGFVVNGASTLIIFEAADNFCTAIGVDGVPKWFLILLGIGFLGSMWFSWIYDFTPDGLVKTEPSKDYPVPLPGKKLKTYKLITFLSVAVIIGMVSFWVIDGFAAKKIKSLEKSIAVLPPDNNTLTKREAIELEFIGHEITSCLLKVRDYRVIPWDDTRNYLRQGKSFSEIGNDLSAALLVIWEPKRTKKEQHLSVDLISASDESLLWSEKYEIQEDWSGSEIFRCSRKISKRITRELKTFLTLEERDQISQQPVSTKAAMLASVGMSISLDTWESIQTGIHPKKSQEKTYHDSISFDEAIRYFDDAIAENPNYAEAYANRAKARLWGIRAGYYKSNALDQCEEDIFKAFGLMSNLPEAFIAMGLYHYYGKNSNRLALVSFEKAVELEPNNTEYLFYLTKIFSTLGQWEKASILANSIYTSNPRNALYLTNLGTIYLYLGNFERSLQCQDRAIELLPEWIAPYKNKIETLLAMGDLSEAKHVLLDAEKNSGKKLNKTKAELLYYSKDYNEALDAIENSQIREYSGIGESEGDALLWRAKILDQLKMKVAAKEYYHQAVDYFTDMILENPVNPIAHSKLGLSFAGLGKKAEAIQSGNTAMELANNEPDAIIEPYFLYYLIQIQATLQNMIYLDNLFDELSMIRSRFTKEFLDLDPVLPR